MGVKFLRRLRLMADGLFRTLDGYQLEPAVEGMGKITSADQRKLSNFVRELYALDSAQRISERVAQGLGTLIGAESVFVARADPKRNMVSLLADNIGPELQKLWPTLVALRHENPAISYHMSNPEGPALMIEDLLPMSQWKRTAVYNEFYSRLEMRERLSISLSLFRLDITGIVAHRKRAPFTERDRAVLDFLRFHVSEACSTAKGCPALALPSVLEALEWLVGGSIVTLDGRVKVQFCSDLAQRYFESFFPNEGPVSEGLPASVRSWVLREITHFESDDLGMRPPQPLLVRRGERTLHVRMARINEGVGSVLLLRAEDPVFELAKLSILGLGARPTEVLYWLAKGKTNKEIGMILSMATETVKAHLKDIYSRLAIENRATAAVMISELLFGV
jgi:DNA-binding CsgD family transcriptional regulator